MTISPIAGSLVGTAIGDALGLPYEGLSRRRAERLFGPATRHRFLFGRGMVSDDTEHACMAAQSLIAGWRDVDAFRDDLASRLRWWLAALPAGTGLATLRAILKLWAGVSPERSGVMSAGNGPAMRAPILGAAIEDPEELRRFVSASTRMTHRDPKADYGAFATALAARMAAADRSPSIEHFQNALTEYLPSEAEELRSSIDLAVGSAGRGESTRAFADSLGLSRGVTGYVYHTVPVVLHAWFRHPRDYAAAVRAVIECGGDTDSTAAIVGGIVGAAVGIEGIPPEWINSMIEWPRTMKWIERLAMDLEATIANNKSGKPPRLPTTGVLARNAVFLTVVLAHGFRRLAPPW